MASTFGGNRLEAGIHASGYKETSQISPSSVQAVLHGDTAFSPQQHRKGHLDTSHDHTYPYYFSFIGGKIRKQNLPVSKGIGDEGQPQEEEQDAITLQDMDEAITCAVEAQTQLRKMSITERRLLLESILSSPGQKNMFDSDKIFAAAKDVQADQQDRQRAMECIAYFTHLFPPESQSPTISSASAGQSPTQGPSSMLKGKFLFESNTTDGHLQTTLHTLSRGVIGVLLSSDVGLTPMASILAPAIMSGCSLVIKVSHSNPLIGYVLSKILEAARLTALPGVINIVSGVGDEIGRALVMDDRIEKVIYCGSIQTAAKIQSTKTWLHLQKIHFRSPFANKAVAMIHEDCDSDSLSRFLQVLPDLWMQSVVDGRVAIQRKELVEIKHIFVDEKKWHEVCLEVRGCLNAMRDKYEKFPSHVLSPKLKHSSSASPSSNGGSARASFSGASTVLSGEVSSRLASEKHNHKHKQTHDYIEEMIMQGADVCAVPIALHHHDNLSENQQPEPIMFTAIFSDSANGATCSRFSQDLVGPVLHFHRCANPHKMIECANLCLIQSLAWYQVLFCHSTATSSMNQRDPSKCFWLNGDLKSSCVLVNHGYHDIHTKIMDHDVLDFFLKKRSVSVCQG